MENIVVADKTTSQLTANAWGDLALNNPSVVQMPVAPGQVASASRSGQDLVVNLKNGEHIKVANFFNTGPDGVQSDMVFQGDDGALWQARYDAQVFRGFTFEEVSSIDELIAGVGVVGSATPTWAIAGLGLLGAGGAAAAAGGAAGGGGGGGGGAGSPDTTAPEAPTGLGLSADGLSLSGLGEAGSRVTVLDAAGNVLGTGTVGNDGRFQVVLNAPQTNGQALDVTLTDAAGNVSAPGSLIATDTTAPTAPGNLTLSADGQSLSGTGEAGSNVVIRDAAGNVLGTAVVGSDGTFQVILNAPQTNGQVLSVTLTDAAGNVSASGSLTAADTTAPNAPGNLAVSADGSALSGTGEAGATIQVRAADGTLLGTATVAPDGTFNVTLNPPQTDGQSLTVNAVDAAGNSSLPAQALAPDTGVTPPDDGDVTPPDAPTTVAISGSGSLVSGRGEPGSTVNVIDANGTLLGTGIVGADGSFSVGLNPAPANGQLLQVTLTDAAGNVSSNVPLQAPDITAPAQPGTLGLSADGLTLTGVTEPGARVLVRDASGAVIGSARAGLDGTFSVTLATAQTNGERLDVSATDAAGNTSTAPLTAADTTAPDQVTNVVISADGALLSGTGEIGATVTVLNAGGTVIGTGIVGANGTFLITLTSAPTAGEQLQVIQTDAAGNPSSALDVTAPDNAGPATPANLVLDASGTQLTGSGTAGNLIEVRDAQGNLLGSAVVGNDGTFTLTLTPAQANGEVITVTATDALGENSVSVPLTAPDITGPLAASDLAVAQDGLSITGRGEPGAAITITNAQGIVLGTGTVSATGAFSVVLNAAQTNGQALQVVLTDASGNPSPLAPVVAGDLDGPLQPDGLSLSTDGTLLSGRGEAGSRITVTDANGNVLGTANVAADGSFNVTLSVAQNNGQTLLINASDSAGNPATPVSFTAPDTQAPTPLTNVALDASGVVLTGTGEPGASVIVRDAFGTVIGTGSVGQDGTFSLNLTTTQTDGQVLQVTQADVAGNPSTPVPVNAPDLSVPDAVTNVVISANGAMVTGNGQVGATVTVTDASGNPLGTALVGTNGRFEINLSSPQINGQVLNVSQADGSVTPSTPVPVDAPDIQAPGAPDNLTLNSTGVVLSGLAEPGATVYVRDQSGNLLGTATADATTGAFQVTLSAAQNNGQTVQVTQADTHGNLSTSAPFTAADTTPADAPSNVAITADGHYVSGNGIAGDTIEVRNANGTLLGTAVVAANGSFTVTLTSPQQNGEALNVTQIDASQLPSAASSVTAPDITAPPAPTDLAVDANGVLTGTTEAGATVNVLDANGNLLGSTTAGTNGQFTFNLPGTLTNGQSVQVIVSDGTHDSLPVTTQAPDTTPPPPVANLTVSPDGTQASGTGEPGTTITITDPGNVVIGTGVVGNDGVFVIGLNPPAGNGSVNTVVSTDSSGNPSTPVALPGPDGTQVATPTDLAISSDGFTLTGAGTPGSTVTVLAGDGTNLGSGTVNSLGRFTIFMRFAQLNAQTLHVTASDASGHTSVPGTVIAADSTAPEAPSDLTLNSNGSAISGKGEVGATVTITNSSGAILGTGVVAANGNFSIVLNPAQINSQPLTATQSDAAGNVSQPGSVVAPDLQAPNAATGLSINSVGTVISGQGEAGATVTVRDAAGNVLATGTVDQSGQFQVTLPNAQTSGAALQITLTDAAGNTSPQSSLNTVDTTPPALVQNLTISASGNTLTGTGEVGATVRVTDSNGTLLGSGVVAADGSFSVTLAPAQDNGQTLDVNQVDASGNASPSATVQAPDISPPAALTQVAVNADGLTVTGHGEPGATVSVRSVDGTLLGTGLVAANGSFNLTLNAPQLNAQVLTVTQEDPPGNVSTAVEVVSVDLTPPDAPTALSLNGAGLQLTGNAEAGSSVIVRDASGGIIGTTTAAANGTFQVTLGSPQLNGQALTVTATDAAGNVSNPAAYAAADTTAPLAVSDLAVTADGLSLAGHGEAGATVVVRDANGVQLGTATVNANGNFTLTLTPGAAAGTVLNVIQTDAAGNASPQATVTAPGNLAEPAPANLSLSADGLTLTGTATAGSTVSIHSPSGTLLGTALVASDGTFSATLNTAQLNGEQLSATATSSDGINSLPTDYTAADVTAPAPLSNLVLAADGSALTGHGEAGATVTVMGAGGVILGNALVAANGTFSLTLTPPQIAGQTLNLSQTDAAGNESISLDLVARDLVAPDAPAALAVSSDGSVLSGTGEAGTTVNVFSASGALLGSGTVRLDGSFQITLSTPQANGQTLAVTLTDTAGNTSATSSLIAIDTTAPAALTQLGISSDGATLTGHGEAGATVTVTDTDGTLLGTVVVGSTGTFTLVLTNPLTNAEVLTLVQTDTAGNVSPGATLITPDFTPPDPLANVDINAAGAVVTGTGEPGATVTVKDPAGNVLGTSVVLGDGSFSVTLSTPQINNQTLSVQQADPPGNVSASVSVTAPDLTPPPVPTQLLFNADGGVLSGNGEANATVRVTLADGTQIGTGSVDASGHFLITLTQGQTNGEQVFVVLTDARGNASAAGNLFAPDTTAPNTVANLAIDEAGSVVSGTGEAGAQIVVSDNAGNVLGTATVSAGGTFTLTLSVPQLNGETLSVIQRDTAGNPSAPATVDAPDITAPAQPVVTGLSADGVTLTGTGEAGATVQVTSATGAALGTATVDTDGTFSVTLNPAQLNGQVLTLTQTDDAANVSGNATYQVPDVTDPAPVSNLAVSLNGLILSGTGEAGATVNVSFQGAPLGTAIVAADGTFSVNLSTAQLNGQVLSVVQVDAGTNDSAPVTVTAPDITAPALPTVIALTGGTVLTGTAEAGSTVTVTSANGAFLGSATALGDGTYTVNLNASQTNGETLLVTATDGFNNASATLPFVAPDTTDPDPVSNLSISPDYTQLAGRGEVGASVTVSVNGVEIGNGTVGANGTFVITLTGVTANQTLSVVQTDGAGNDSTASTLVVPLTPPPNAPDNLVLTPDGVTLTGTAASGATITVYGPTGAQLGTGTAGTDDTFTVTLSPAQTNGEVLDVTASTALGGASVPSEIVAGDTTAPLPLTDLAINATGTTVTGRGEIGATVTITSATGTALGTAVVGANGTFSAQLNSAQANGQILNAFQTDTAGNPSPALSVIAPDITAPTAPSALGLDGTGLLLTGLGEAGATVTVRSAAGLVLGTGTVAANGTFSITLNTAQLNGQPLTVSQADAAGNVSASTGLTAADTTPPAALSNLTLNAAGLQLSGTGEPGATVSVTNAAGQLLGTAVVGAGATFTVQLSSAQLNGQALTVQQADPAGNLSPVANLVAADVQAPTAPTGLALAANGLTVSGSGEAGATVNVYSAGGALLGTGTVGSGGTFNFNLTSAAQLDGQPLTVRLVDGAGNVSAAGSLTAPDTTAPAAPTGVAINGSGTVLSGLGVAGSTVTVRNAAGVVLGTGTVAANGSFSVALAAAQIDNQVLSVTQADPSGNVSVSATATAPDLTAPVAPTTLLVSGDGLTVSGTGEAGATVTIKSASGVVLGTAVVGGTGVFSVGLNAAQINGEKLSVSLTDIHGNVSVATVVTAPDIDANAPVVASDNLATATVVIAPVKVTQNFFDSFSTLLSGFSKTFTFTVASGTSIDPTLTLTTGSLVSLLDGVSYTLQVKSASGAWVTLDVNGSGGLLDLIAIAGQGVRVNIGDLLGGDYRLTVASSGIGVLTTVNTQLQLDITSLTQFTGTAGAAITGNVISDVGTDGQIDQTGPDQGALLQIQKNGSYVAAGGGTTVQGLYGTLTIDASGNYSYKPNGSLGSVGKVDVFSYQLVHANGLSDTATLYVRIDSPQATEIWSNTNLGSPALLVDATNDIAHTGITLVNQEVTTTSALGSFGVLLGGGSGTYTTSVAANTVSDLTVVVNASNLLSLLGAMTVSLYKLNTSTGQYVLVKSYGGSSLVNLGSGNYGIQFDDQTSGSYQVKVAVGGLGVLSTVNTSLINAATYTNQFVVGSYTPVTGNLLTDSAGAGADVLGSAYTVLSVQQAGTFVTPGYNGTTLVGTYGSLLVHADGSYVYTLNPGQTNAVIGHQDVFTYQLTHPNGTTDTATLTVDLDPAGAVTSTSFAALASVDDHSAASVATTAAVTGAELIQGTDGNDTLDGSHGGAVTLQGGAGNDTLIISDQQFASVDGGTGTDTLLWAGGDAVINLGDLQSRVHNIEVLDLNHTSAVSLTVSLADLVAITSSDNSTLLIKGDSKDTVHMTDTWAADGTHQADGIDYTQYTPQEDPSHHLWVQNGIQVV
ncbi:BapA/Bap/LapF family large adhesin [Pseudomonas abietaniphila]|uniref:BapA/Bap/LapF family large adhesin n=1 Tax=Pseudomonas abietaniphila TaxID=89065 RepID=UPI0007865F20|nr:BapA/Bap/LapF family large adhesin [Pseudomonas abietaniphila]